MRKAYHIISVILAVVISASCTLIEDSSRSTVKTELGYFSNNMVDGAVISPVKVLMDCMEKKAEVLQPGFETTQNGVFLKLVSAKDSTWTAVNANESDQLQFTSTIKMLKDSKDGLHQFSCTGEGTYFESDTYMATLETLATATMEWVTTQTTTLVETELKISGKFLCTTYLRKTGETIDKCTLTYDKSSFDSHWDYTSSLASRP